MDPSAGYDMGLSCCTARTSARGTAKVRDSLRNNLQDSIQDNISLRDDTIQNKKQGNDNVKGNGADENDIALLTDHPNCLWNHDIQNEKQGNDNVKGNGAPDENDIALLTDHSNCSWHHDTKQDDEQCNYVVGENVGNEKVDNEQGNYYSSDHSEQDITEHPTCSLGADDGKDSTLDNKNLDLDKSELTSSFERHASLLKSYGKCDGVI